MTKKQIHFAIGEGEDIQLCQLNYSITPDGSFDAKAPVYLLLSPWIMNRGGKKKAEHIKPILRGFIQLSDVFPTFNVLTLSNKIKGSLNYLPLVEILLPFNSAADEVMSRIYAMYDLLAALFAIKADKKVAFPYGGTMAVDATITTQITNIVELLGSLMHAHHVNKGKKIPQAYFNTLKEIILLALNAGLAPAKQEMARSLFVQLWNEKIAPKVPLCSVAAASYDNQNSIQVLTMPASSSNYAGYAKFGMYGKNLMQSPPASAKLKAKPKDQQLIYFEDRKDREGRINELMALREALGNRYRFAGIEVVLGSLSGTGAKALQSHKPFDIYPSQPAAGAAAAEGATAAVDGADEEEEYLVIPNNEC